MIQHRRSVRKAVLPVAGLGTRMLPATKAVRKEMLPLLNKPMIQFAVEECHASGIEEVIIVTGPGKSAIEAHFAADPALEALLDRSERQETAEAIRRLSRLVRMRFACQEQPLGLGHAVLCAKSLVGHEPFAVLLPDVFFLGPRPAIAQLMEVHRKNAESVIAAESVPPERVAHCGIIAVAPESPREHLLHVRGVVEKPAPSEAPSDLAIMGRYLLEPDVFDCLESIVPGSGEEIQLTDALAILARNGTLRALLCEGKALDAGNPQGFFQLSVELALRDPKLGAWLRWRLGVSAAEPPIHTS